MLTTYCLKNDSKVTIEIDCLKCEYFYGAYIFLDVSKTGCTYLEERLKIGL